MQKPSGEHVHDCTVLYMYVRANKWACMHCTYLYAAWIFTYLMIAANTQRPNISHVIHDMHLACKKMANVFRRPRTFYLLQGRFCTGQTQLHMQMCPGGHSCIMQQRPGGHDCICKTVRRTLLHNMQYCNTILRIVLHRWHYCMRHRPPAGVYMHLWPTFISHRERSQILWRTWHVYCLDDVTSDVTRKP